MISINKKGFTLVELLAVIVILGILLLLAMPAVTRQMDIARRKAFTEDANTIADTVKNDILEGDVVLTENGNIEYDKDKINALLDKKLGKSPFGGQYTVAQSKVKITKDNTGKKNYTIFVCLVDENGNGFGYTSRDNIDADNIIMGEVSTSAENCDDNTISSTTVIERNNKNNPHYTDNNPTHIDSGDNSQLPSGDVDESRFTGDNKTTKNNFVYFNCSDTANQNDSTCDLYRIIGTFFVEDGSGNFEQRVKLIAVDDVSLPEPNSGKWDINGSNDWTKSSLMEYLNTTYYNSINQKYKDLIGNTKYYLGGYKNADITRAKMFEYERKSGNDAEGTYFHSYNEDSTYWVGKIGLMYASDYGYASEDLACENVNLSQYDTSSDSGCGNTWIAEVGFQRSPSWLLNQVSSTYQDAYFTNVHGVDKSISVSGSNHPSHPVFYLTSEAEFVKGSGTRDDPYRLFK